MCRVSINAFLKSKARTFSSAHHLLRSLDVCENIFFSPNVEVFRERESLTRVSMKEVQLDQMHFRTTMRMYTYMVVP